MNKLQLFLTRLKFPFLNIYSKPFFTQSAYLTAGGNLASTVPANAKFVKITNNGGNLVRINHKSTFTANTLYKEKAFIHSYATSCLYCDNIIELNIFALTNGDVYLEYYL